MTFKNSKPQVWITIAGALLVAFLTFTVHKIYITDPQTMATKKEVVELKADLCDKLSDMKSIMGATNAKLDWLIQQHVKP